MKKNLIFALWSYLALVYCAYNSSVLTGVFGEGGFYRLTFLSILVMGLSFNIVALFVQKDNQ